MSTLHQSQSRGTTQCSASRSHAQRPDDACHPQNSCQYKGQQAARMSSSFNTTTNTMINTKHVHNRSTQSLHTDAEPSDLWKPPTRRCIHRSLRRNDAIASGIIKKRGPPRTTRNATCSAIQGGCAVQLHSKQKQAFSSFFLRSSQCQEPKAH